MIARALLALLLLAGPEAATAQAPRAEGGVRLVEALEASPASVVGVVLETRPLDARSHLARVRVEQALGGDAESGTVLSVAWEELAASRAPRFAADERLLVALEALPGHSIWRTRLPDPSRRARTLGVAMDGDAFLRSPSLGSVRVLDHYLALAPEDRRGEAGVAYLAQLAADAELPLALDAVARLRERSELDARLTSAAARGLVRALVRPDGTPALRDALVGLVERRRLASLREPLAALAGGEALAPPAVYAALATLDGGLSAEGTARLLEQESARHREVAARHAGGSDAPAELATLLHRDPDPSVRIGAVERLVELRGQAAIPAASDALFDPDARVRTAAARVLGSLGAAAVPELRTVTQATDVDAARAAVAALALTGGPEAEAALEEIAADHSDASIRMLAGVALGRDLGHTHR